MTEEKIVVLSTKTKNSLKTSYCGGTTNDESILFLNNHYLMICNNLADTTTFVGKKKQT
jgi:hypothetical protein